MTVDLDGSRDTADAGGTVHAHIDRDAYRAVIVETCHSPELEAAIDVACAYRRARHKAYVDYLRNGANRPRRARPGYANQSARWREAEAAEFAAVSTLAAALAVMFPPPSNTPPISETRELIERRVGPLCTGWSTRDDGLVDTHAVDDSCPVHPPT